MTAGYGAAQVIRFATNVVLARLLFPDAFGLMLLVNVFLQGLQLFTDVGIGASIIQNERSDERFLNTAWTVQILRGALLWAATVLLAWPAATLYSEPQLRWMLPVAGVATFLDGFAATAVYTANRQLRMARLQGFELTIQASASVVMIVGAWLTGSVWALLAGRVATSATRTLLSHVLLPGVRNRMGWDREAAGKLLHFGKWVFASSIVTFLAQQGDRLLFGKMLPLSRLGVYNVALALVEAPSSLVSAVSFQVVFPMFSELRRSSPDVDAAYRRASSAMALLGGAGALGLVIAGPWVVHLLYDARYAEASWMIRLLALGIWGNSLVHFTASVVLASGQVRWLAAANGARLLWVATTVPLAFARWGFEVAIAFVVLADVPRYVFLGLACRREGLHVFRNDLLRTVALAAAGVAGLLVLGAMPAAPLGGAPAVATALAASLVVWVGGNFDAARFYLAKARGALGARGGRGRPL